MFVHVPEEHCHFYVGMEPSVGGPLFSNSIQGEKSPSLSSDAPMPLEFDLFRDTKLLGVGTPANEESS